MTKPSPRKAAAKKGPSKREADLQRQLDKANAEIERLRAQDVVVRDTDTPVATIEYAPASIYGTREWAESLGWIIGQEQPASYTPQPDGSLRPANGQFSAEKLVGANTYRQYAGTMEGLLKAIASIEDEHARRNPSAPSVSVHEGAGSSLDILA